MVTAAPRKRRAAVRPRGPVWAWADLLFSRGPATVGDSKSELDTARAARSPLTKRTRPSSEAVGARLPERRW